MVVGYTVCIGKGISVAMEANSKEDRGAAVTLTQSQKVWRRIIEHVKNGDYEKAIQLCNTSE